jgi:chromosome segregation ATPase
MFRTFLMSVLLVVPAFALPQESEPVPPAPPSKTSASVSADPFADARRAALDAESQWLEANETLKPHLAELPACSQERTQAVQQVRDLAFDAIARKGDYYKKYRDLLRDQLRLYQKSTADLGVFRGELEGMASAAEESLSDLQRRKTDLKQSSKASGASAEAAVKPLDDLISSTQDRIENLRRSFAQVDEAERYGKQSNEVADALSQSIEQAQLLLQAESALWQAFYAALEARMWLACAVNHRNVFRPFETRRP